MVVLVLLGLVVAAAALFGWLSVALQRSPPKTLQALTAVLPLLVTLAALWWWMRPDFAYAFAALCVGVAAAAYVFADRWDNVAAKSPATHRMTDVYAGAVAAAMTMAFAVAAPGWAFVPTMGLVAFGVAIFAVVDRIVALRWAVVGIGVMTLVALSINPVVACAGSWCVPGPIAWGVAAMILALRSWDTSVVACAVIAIALGVALTLP
jgi:hypothetical protein